MSTSDKDLEIPDLGPAQRDVANAPAVPVAAPVKNTLAPPAARPVEKSSNGNGIVINAVLILLVVGGVVLGYGLMELQKQLQQRTEQLLTTQQQLDQLKESLQVAETSASESGQSLSSQVSKLSSDAQQRVKHVDSELAKLWTVAYQRNKPQLESQQKALESQKAASEQQQKSISDLRKQLSQAESALAKMTKQFTQLSADAKRNNQLSGELANAQQSLAGLSKAIGELNSNQKRLIAEGDSNRKSLKQVSQGLNGSKSELSTQTAILTEQTAQNSDQLASLERQLGKLKADQKKQADAQGLGRRVERNEEALRAFDGTRRQLNNELLTLRKKLNNLQLKLERR